MNEKFQDYYNHINQEWLSMKTLDDDESRFGTFDEISKKTENQIKHILYTLYNTDDSYLSSDNKLLKNIYKKLDDTYTRSEQGINPLNKYFKLINNIKTLDDFAKLSGLFNILGIPLFFKIMIERDLKNNSEYLLYLYQTQCSLPSKKYFTDPIYNSTCIKYKEYISSLLNLLNINKLTADDIFNFEKLIASITLTREEKRDTEKIYNISNFTNLETIFTSFKLKNFFYHFIKLKSNISNYYNKIIIDNNKYLYELDKILLSCDINFLKIYMQFHLLKSSGDYLSQDIYLLNFSFYGKELAGLKAPITAFKQHSNILSEILGEVIGEMYIEKYFNQETRNQVITMVQLIKASTINMITNSKWMQNETKEKAIEKINKITVKIGHSEIKRNYDEIDINNLNLFDSINIFNIFNSKYYLNKLGTKPNLEEFHMNSYETNAYYNLLSNEIVFPAAILLPPFFSIDQDFITNLGSIGSIIAHEISHAFDDQGHKYDQHGNLNSWWTDHDEKEYNNHASKLVQQFDNIKLFNTRVSGKLTLGENLADYTAISILCNVLKEEKLNTKENFKLLFKSYANIWKQKIRKNEFIKRLSVDVHAPGRFRTNQILSNIPEFYSSFNIDSNHKMFIEHNDRIKMWI